MSQEQESNACKVNLDLPYPPIQLEHSKPEYALAMLSNIGSSNSEMNAVSLYFYNSVILEPDYAELAKCFHQISVVEMHHLKIFGNLAYQLGADPRLWSVQNRSKRYWTPAYNRYPRSLRMVIENSIRGEVATVQKYTRQAETICDANIVEILKRIILDEQHHIEILHTILDDVC